MVEVMVIIIDLLVKVQKILYILDLMVEIMVEIFQTLRRGLHMSQSICCFVTDQKII